MPSRAQRIIAFTKFLHSFGDEVMEKQLSMTSATATLQEWLRNNEKPWWEVEKRYPKWLHRPCTPELVEDAGKNTPTFETLWTRDFWHEHALKCLKTEEQRALLTFIVYQHLKDMKVLHRTPSLEAFELYKKDPKLCYKVWDRTGLWVFAWKDACEKTDGKILKIFIPGMRFNPKTKKFECKWVALHNIHKYEFKVLLRKIGT